MSLEEIGEVRHSAPYIIDWTIPSFSLLSQKKSTRIWSPSFVRYNNIKIGSFGAFISEEPDGFIELNFYSKDCKIAPVQCVRFGIADINKSVICCCDGEWKKDSSNGGKFKVAKFVRISVLNQPRYGFFGPPRFRLFCEVLNSQPCQMINASTQTDNACVTDDVRCVDTDEESGENFKLKGENLNDLKSLERLSQNLEQLYIGGKDYDLTIQVQDREFKVHRAVLRARSSVFNAMFTHGLSERSSGVVPIEDSEPDIMEEFLCFVYAGRIRNLSSHNACELYYVADKYDVPDLKEKCISCLKKSLTIETICDIICLATKHNETELLENAILYFAKNMEEILVTVKWQVFLSENPTVANELYIKALKLGFSKRNI